MIWPYRHTVSVLTGYAREAIDNNRPNFTQQVNQSRIQRHAAERLLSAAGSGLAKISSYCPQAAVGEFVFQLNV